MDAAYQRCLQRGDRVHHPPEEDGDIPGYYALFVFDPDGFRIEGLLSRTWSGSSRIHVMSGGENDNPPDENRHRRLVGPRKPKSSK